MRGTVTSLLLCAAVVTTLWPAISASPSAVPMSPAPLPHPAATWVPGGTVNVPVVCGDHVYQDYRSNGTLTFSLGPGILHCDITLRVLGTYVYDGALVVQVQGLTVFTGSLRVFVEDNQQLDGGLLVVVRDNQIHPANPEVSLPYDLEEERRVSFRSWRIRYAPISPAVGPPSFSSAAPRRLRATANSRKRGS